MKTLFTREHPSRVCALNHRHGTKKFSATAFTRAELQTGSFWTAEPRSSNDARAREWFVAFNSRHRRVNWQNHNVNSSTTSPCNKAATGTSTNTHIHHNCSTAPMPYLSVPVNPGQSCYQHQCHAYASHIVHHPGDVGDDVDGRHPVTHSVTPPRRKQTEARHGESDVTLPARMTQNPATSVVYACIYESIYVRTYVCVMCEVHPHPHASLCVPRRSRSLFCGIITCATRMKGVPHHPPP